MRWFVLVVLIVVFNAGGLSAQTATPTPTPTETPAPTPTMDVAVYATMPPPDTGTPGQMTRFDYTISAGEAHIANMLTWLLYSIWGMFLFAMVVLLKRYRSR